MKQLRPDLFAIRGWFGLVHVLVEQDELVLLDTGFIGDFLRVQRAISVLGRRPSDLKAVLLTHGHLDHTTNAARLQKWSGAKLYAPAGDEQHVAGCARYSGVSRVCGWLEAAGRAMVRYQPPRVDVWLRDGEELPFWGGLRVVSLPGHTAGHSGFYSEAKRVLFVGDTFAVSWRIALPPPVFNTEESRVKESLRKAARFDVDWFVPGHYFWLDESVAERVHRKAEKLGAAMPRAS